MLHVTWGIPARSGGGGAGGGAGGGGSIYCRIVMTENLCDFEPVTFPERKYVNESSKSNHIKKYYKKEQNSNTPTYLYHPSVL